MLEGRDWRGSAGASTSAIEELRAAAPAGLPDSYLQLLLFSDGGEGPLPVQPLYVQLDPANEVMACLASGNYGRSDLDGFLIFGSNGGGEYLAFDTRENVPWPVVTIDMVAGLDSTEPVASDFDSFIDLIGTE